ncbi:unnamed protein product, partial [Coregonus sp. 'balchen']
MTSSFASSLLEISSTESDDTVILSDDGSPSRKRQRAEDEAKHKKFGGDLVIKENSRTKGLTHGTRRKMINILTAEMTETH